MDRQQQIHEMVLDFMRTYYLKHSSPEEYVERYRYIYDKINTLMKQHQTLKNE